MADPKRTEIIFGSKVMDFDKVVYVDGRATRPDLQPGAASWWEDLMDRPAILNFVCPCGCHAVHAAPLRAGAWTWNGNKEFPSLAPSILSCAPCKWHGYLTDGIFEEC